jgi:4-diphosphocytidyl-2-C-methyl-D-erythritol kinase
VIINPGIHVNTAWAFTQVRFSESRNLQTAVTQPVEEWKHLFINDFELPVFEKYPAIKKLKEYLYQQNALYASMSGSGSTVFGLFKKNEMIHYPDLPPGSFVKEMDL